MKRDTSFEESIKYFAVAITTLVIYTILNDPQGVLRGILKSLF